MADFSFNRGKKALFNQEIDLGDLKCALMKTSFTPNIDSQNVWSDISASEISGVSGYSSGGAAVSNAAVTESDANDNSKLDADDVAFGSLGAGDTIAYAVVYEVTSGSLLFAFGLTSTPTNGSPVTVAWNANGIATLG